MKIKKIGEIQKKPLSEVVKDTYADKNLREFKIVPEDRTKYFENQSNINSISGINNSSSKKIYYILGGILIFLIISATIYLQKMSNEESVNKKIIYSGKSEQDNKAEENEIKKNKQEINYEISKSDKVNQNSNEDIKPKIINGYYQVGNVFCTIETNRNAITLKWNKGSGYTKLKETVQGYDVVYKEYDSGGIECGYFYFENGFQSGNYYRSDGKIFKVKKIR